MRNRTETQSLSGRPKRTPVGMRNRLTVSNKDPNYEYRIVNDNHDRIQMFLDAGYELVPTSEVRVGDSRLDIASSEGSNAQVSVGGGKKAFVMRIKKEWYEEDQERKSAHIKELEQTMLSDEARQEGRYGDIRVKSSISREHT